MPREVLSVFSPLPPEQNGIADYTYNLLKPLSTHYHCAAYVAEPQAIVPPGVEVHDPAQAFRWLNANSRILHQIGNNIGHVFVLQALRRWSGVTTLHDQNLHYLYEIAGTSGATMRLNMTRTSARMGAAYARHWQQENVKTQANYALFDMLSEILAESSALVVHSRFAKRRITALYGRTQGAHVAVIPHLALPFVAIEPQEAAARLNVSRDRPLIVTSGFATAAKRFDWLVEALEEIGLRGGEFLWVHAGKERPEEYGLTALLEQYPYVRERTRITGYVSEDDLNQYIAACDILVNLRFPSVGESSGTLARSMSAGKCCVVSDTAAYSELPRDTVVHVPVQGAVPYLVEALEVLLKSAPARLEIGAAAKRLATSEWAPEIVAAAYHDVIEDGFPAKNRVKPPRQAVCTVPPICIRLAGTTTQDDVVAAIGANFGVLEIIFILDRIEDLAEMTLSQPRMLAALLPPTFSFSAIRLERDGPIEAPLGTVRLRIKGNLP